MMKIIKWKGKARTTSLIACLFTLNILERAIFFKQNCNFIFTSFAGVDLTSYEHDADGEDLLRVGVWGDVPEANAGQTAEGEVQSRNIFISDGRTWPDDGLVVRPPELLAQIVQPANPSRGRPLHIPYGVPGGGKHVKCTSHTRDTAFYRGSYAWIGSFKWLFSTSYLLKYSTSNTFIERRLLMVLREMLECRRVFYTQK